MLLPAIRAGHEGHQADDVWLLAAVEPRQDETFYCISVYVELPSLNSWW